MTTLPGKSCEKGHTLVEALIVIVIMGLILLGVVGTILIFQQSSWGFNQRLDAVDREKVLSRQLADDFETAGYNLAESAEPPSSGFVENDFETTEGYTSTVVNGKTNVSFNDDRTGQLYFNKFYLASGLAEMSFTPGPLNDLGCSCFQSGFYTAENYLQIFGYKYQSKTFMEIYTANDASITMELKPGDRIVSNINPTGNRAALRVIVQRGDENILAFNAYETLPYPIYPYLTLSGDHTIYDLKLKGADWKRNSAATVNRAPLMPMISVTRMPSAVRALDKFIYLLTSNIETDPMYSTSSVTFANTTTAGDVTLNKPVRGTLATGDFVMLFDYDANKSLLGKVTQVQDAGAKQIISVTPSSSSNRAWSLVYSADGDYLNHQFKPGTKIVKMESAIVYQAVKDATGDDYSITRRVRSTTKDVSETVAYGIKDFKIEQVASSVQNSYKITFGVQTEDKENTDPREVKLTLTPGYVNKR